MQFRETLPCFQPNKEEPPQEQTFILYATGDVPYTALEVVKLEKQIHAIPSDAQLVLHVGDIRRSTLTPCVSSEYEFVHGILNQSIAPLLLVLGDNEWNDCSNVDEAYSHWHTYFAKVEKHWPSLEALVVRDQLYPEVFSLVQKGVLVIGLNLVGGRVHNATEWQTRLTYQFNKVQEIILDYWEEKGTEAKVILAGHADPRLKHDRFFTPLKDFIANTLDNQVPLIYVNGDSHRFSYEPNFLEQPSLLRVMVQGGAAEAPIRIQVNLDVNSTDPAVVFTVLRDAFPF